MNFSLELNFFILSHPVTSKQPHKIVQIHMGHSVKVNKTSCSVSFEIGKTCRTSADMGRRTWILSLMQSFKKALNYLPHVDFMYWFLSSCLTSYTLVTNDLAYVNLVYAVFFDSQKMHKPSLQTIVLWSQGDLK